MSKVSIERLRKVFGTAVAVSDFSLEIADGELVAFLGPSGCGKTTTLRMVAGFVEPTSGSIRIGDNDVTYLPPHRRNTGMVFQRYALFPHMTVSQNVSFGLEMRKFTERERDQRIKEVLGMVRMWEFRERYPRQLSGGQQQRVAIARALAIRPEVFLLDEPLSNLDAKLRVEVREEIRGLQQDLGLTSIFVTHDQEEALTIADRLAVMHDGRIQQIGTADELYERPINRFVADFLGQMNFFSGRTVQPYGFLSDSKTPIAVENVDNNTKTVGVRPERIVFGLTQRNTENNLKVTVASALYRGPIIEVRATTENGDGVVCHVPNSSAHILKHITVGTKAFASFRAKDCISFSN